MQQNDAVRYINDEMKKGVNISNFRKEKLGSASDGTVYWCVFVLPSLYIFHNLPSPVTEFTSLQVL
jgi:hypothetical protein